LECESAGVGGVTGGSARQWCTFEEQFAQVVSAIYFFLFFLLVTIEVKLWELWADAIENGGHRKCRYVFG